MPVTGQGPASSTVTRSTRPSSRNSWVMPSFLARIAATRCSPPVPRACGDVQGRAGRGRRGGDWPLGHDRPGAAVRGSSWGASGGTGGGRRTSLTELDLDVHAGREMVEPLERVDGL